MNLKSLVLVLFAGVLYASASPDNRAASRLLSNADANRVSQIIFQGAHPESLAELLDGRLLEYSCEGQRLLFMMIANYKPALFETFFEHFDIDADRVDETLSKLLDTAIYCGNTEVCDWLLSSYDFEYVPGPQSPWLPKVQHARSWNLDEFKQLVSDYPDIAAAICPTPAQLPYEQYSANDVSFLIEFTHYCASASEGSENLVAFNPSVWTGLANRERFLDVERDRLLARLIELDAEVDPSIIEQVELNPLTFYRTYGTLRARSMITPISAEVDGLIWDLQESEYNMLSELLFQGEIPEAVLELLAEFQFEWSAPWKRLFCKMLYLRRHESFMFFFQRMVFFEMSRDEGITIMVRSAVRKGNMWMFRYLICHDFRIAKGHDLFYDLPEDILGEILQVLHELPVRAAQMAPSRQSLQQCDGAAQAHLMIDLATRLNPSGIDPSELLLGLIQNHSLGDAAMARLIERLCQMGAVVNDHVFAVLEELHPGYAESVETLRQYELDQESIKDPNMA
jgi:hypothetical protein